MITTRREVEIENGNTEVTATVRRITPEENIVRVTPNVEVGATSFAEAAVRTSVAEEPIRITPKMDMGDLMPTIRSEEAVDEEIELEPPLSRKTKMALCVYLASAFIIALIVLITGVAITNTTSEIAALESRVYTQSMILEEQDAQIKYLSDDETIMAAAEAMGMVESTDATEIEMLTLSDSVTYEAKSNAFDVLCDFLSNIIGG